MLSGTHVSTGWSPHPTRRGTKAGNCKTARLGSYRVIRRFTCSDQETRSVLSDMRGQMVQQGLDDENLGTLELVLAEALNNITEHAYGPEGGPVELLIEVAPASDTPAQCLSRCCPSPGVRVRESAAASTGEDGGVVILCEVRDYGRPMPTGGPPDPGLPEIAPPDVLPEGGFGWHIIRCLVADLSYERIGDCNCLRLTMQASPAS
jgi:serine/threonine-protein kinase RsbW